MRLRGLDGERGLADSGEAGNGGNENGRGLRRPLPGRRIQRAQQRRRLLLPAGEAAGPRRKPGHRLGYGGCATLLDHDLYADHLTQEDPAPEVGVVAVVPGVPAARRMPLHDLRDRTGNALRICSEQGRHGLAPFP